MFCWSPSPEETNRRMTRITDPDFRLRDHHTPPQLPRTPRTGLGLGRLHGPTLKLTDYIHRELASPPAAVSDPHADSGSTGDATPTIAATVAVDPSNLTECRIAIDEFAELHVAIALPNTARGQTEWTVVGDGRTGDSAPGSWGAQGILYREYDPDTFKGVTWGAQLLVTVPFHRAYARDAHVVITTEMLHRQGIGPSGVAWDELIADIKALPRQRIGGNPSGAALTALV
jgi:hypothetical protein